MTSSGPSNRARLARNFLISMAYFAVMAGLLSGDWISFGLILLGLVCSVVVCGGIILWWMTLWASRKDSRWGQFTVGSFLFAMFFIALFCGTVSGIIQILESIYQQIDPGIKVLIWIGCTVAVLFSLYPGLLLLDVLLHTATWVIKRPWAQRRIFRRKEKGGEKKGDITDL